MSPKAPGIIAACLAVGSAGVVLLDVGRPGPRALVLDRDNILWRAALEPYPVRYAGLDEAAVADLKRHEEEYRILLEELTAVDGSGASHGKFHHSKQDRESRLWTLLSGLPPCPGSRSLIRAALDDVYLGYHGNHWRGVWWHWPYLDCAKAIRLADRLATEDPAWEEEALWTRIYCYRVLGWDELRSYREDLAKGQQQWTADPGRARTLCQDLIRKYPTGKYAARAGTLAEQQDLVLDPGWSSAPIGPTYMDPRVRAAKLRTYRGPPQPFLIDRTWERRDP